MEKIISSDNKKFKLVLSLRKANKRKKEGLILIEGKKEIEFAAAAGVEIQEIIFCDEFAEKNLFYYKASSFSRALFVQVTYREKPDGFLAIAKRPENNLGNIKLNDKSLILVLEAVEKPGNIGAMLRTADAVQVDAVVLSSPKTDLYNPNVLRSSLGAIFTVPVFVGENDEVLNLLNKNKINIYSAGLKASVDFRKPNYKQASAIVIGTEHEGLSDFWLEHSKANIKIPMRGTIDSLNASVSAALVLYEVERQRL